MVPRATVLPVTTARRLHYRYEEYLAALEVSGVRLEYCDGEIYAMAGGTPAQADLAASLNPSLVVEVTSNSTEDYDRGEKLNHYQQCQSLQAVLIASHRRPQLTVFARAGDGGWQQREYRSGQQFRIEQLDLPLGVDEVYSGVELDAGAT
jgi:Uma2 family endonuclease